jgi:choline-phosphate cytidylyltransferase
MHIDLHQVPTSLKTPAPVFEWDGVATSDEIDSLEQDEEYTTHFVRGKAWKIPRNRPVRVYADGVYDLCHMGHAYSLQEAKNLFPNTFLICGVSCDHWTHKIKGSTVMNEAERVESIRQCRYVDQVISKCMWIATMDYLRKYKIDYIVHGEDPIIADNGVNVYQPIIDNNRFITLPRATGEFSTISTSEIIHRIVKDHKTYVKRNKSRGYSFDTMNVSYLTRLEVNCIYNYYEY